ncbi:MAG TPA: hypothetical protein VL588_12885 [Bdellovibrionota bacterium]|nr:hypothetical protein [Bdellovibrionota bacterium]
MRATSRKLIAALVGLQMVGLAGVAALGIRLFSADQEELLRWGTVQASYNLASRVRSEMKHLADLGRVLASSALQEFKTPEDRLKFIQEGMKIDSQFMAMAAYIRATPGAPFTAQWRIYPLELQQKLGLKDEDFNKLDQEAALDLEAVGRGGVSFTTGRLPSGEGVLRMAVPFLRTSDGTVTTLLVLEADPDKLSSLFSLTAPFTSFLLDKNGRVLASTLPKATPIEDSTQFSGSRDAGFAGLTVMTQVPRSRAGVVRNPFMRQTGLAGGALIFLSLALGFALTRREKREHAPIAEAAVPISVQEAPPLASTPEETTEDVPAYVRPSAPEAEPGPDPEELRQLWQDQAELGVVRDLFGLMREGLSLADFSSKVLDIASDLFQMNHALFMELRQGSDPKSQQLFVRAQSGGSGDGAWESKDLWDRFCEVRSIDVEHFLGHQGAHCLLLEAPMDADMDKDMDEGSEDDLEDVIDISTGELPLAHRIVSAFYGSAPGRPQVLLIPLVIRGRLFGCLAFYGSPEYLAARHVVFLSATRFGEAVATLLEYRFMLVAASAASTTPIRSAA